MKHILIDYENIQPKSFSDIDTSECHIWLFLGVHQQKSLPLELVETLLQFNSQNVHLIKMQNSGKNALDFYLAFYLGKISEIDRNADVCILARDSGYDVLVEHLNSVYDGMDIIRSANTEQLTVADDAFEDAASSAIKEKQPVVEDSPPAVCISSHQISMERDNDIVYSIEETVSKSVVEDCYVLVFDSIVNRKALLPNYKLNLLNRMKKYVPVEVLASFNTTEQDYIFEKVFDKFVKLGLISIDIESNKLSYKVSSQGVLELVADHVLQSRAKTVTGLNNVIKQKLATYRQVNDEKEVRLVLTWLKKQGLVRQDNQKICYPALDSQNVTESKARDSGPQIAYQRAMASIKSRPISNRPSKKSALKNHLQSHLRNEDPKVIDNIIKQMIANKVVTTSNTNKLSYKV